MAKCPSPRQVVGVLDNPPRIKDRLSHNQTEKISKKLKKPGLIIDSFAKGTKVSDELGFLVSTKLGGPLRERDITEHTLAKIIADAAIALKWVRVGSDGKEALYKEVPDHTTRLTVVAMLFRHAGADKPAKIEVDHKHRHLGLMATMNQMTPMQLEDITNSLAASMVSNETPKLLEKVIVNNGRTGEKTN